MKKALYFIATIASALSVLAACSKSEPQQGNTVVLLDKDVAGNYEYVGYSASLKYELEISFMEDRTGSGKEMVYHDSGEFLRVHQFQFTWEIKGSNVFMSGVSASVREDGSVSASETWEGGFYYKYGLLLPGKSFIGGYATKAIYDKKKRDVAESVNGTVRYSSTAYKFSVSISSGLDAIWEDMTIKYGIREELPSNYKWFATGGKTVSFAFDDAGASSSLRSLKALENKEKSGIKLSQSEIELRNECIKDLAERVDAVRKGDMPYPIMVDISGDTFYVPCEYIITAEEEENGGDNGENGNSGDSGNDNPAGGDNNGDGGNGNGGGSESGGGNSSGGGNGDTSTEKYVDMGLSVKWATCNIGASKPEEYGDYYAWGETETKTTYTWRKHKYYQYSDGSLTKYNTNSSSGTVDNKTVLEPEDDVAHVKLGGKWRMPTYEEWTELRENCTWTCTTQNGVNGMLGTSKKNSNSIFLPAAGNRDDDRLDNAGSYGYYWSASLYTDYPRYAFYVLFDSGNVYRRIYYRYLGFSVRPVTE